jgi:hypothetical protein
VQFFAVLNAELIENPSIIERSAREFAVLLHEKDGKVEYRKLKRRRTHGTK